MINIETEAPIKSGMEIIIQLEAYVQAIDHVPVKWSIKSR